LTAKIPVETLILAHPNVDWDAFAGMLAAQLLYPGARICLHGGANRNVREFYNLHADEIPSVELAAVDPGTVRRLVLVETTDPGRLGPLAELAQRPEVEVIAFDHHHGPAGEHVVSADDGSLATAMLRLLLDRGIQITPMHATAFALGIHEDTGSLTYTSTTARDVEGLAACLRLGAGQEQIGRYLRGPLQPAQRELLGELVRSRAEREVAGLRVVTAAARAGAWVEDASSLASRVGDLADWDALFLAVGMEGRVLLVARSRTPALAADAALEPFGGGGHEQAASAMASGEDPEDLLEQAVAAAERVAQPPLRAGDVMSTPVHSVDGSHPIAETLVECQRLRLSGIQVRDDGQITGVVFREDLDRAIRHGLGHAPVKGVMSAGVPVIGRSATLGALRALLAGGSAGRLVVVEDGSFRTEAQVPAPEALGVVTRGDLLRALHEPGLLERPAPAAEVSLAVRERLNEIERLRHVLPAIQAVAAPFEGVYLVGGAVRDVLLGEQSLDLDVMVEGDAIEFARLLAQHLGVDSHAHERFETAVVKGVDRTGAEVRVDVAGARTEFYGAPGALPEVERSTLRYDLARRDFTINAMATSLKPGTLGDTYDFSGGYRDLRNRTVRVLHNLSFVEDPTRLLRAVRYEARLGFNMDGHTLSLARGCIDMKLVGDLASARLRDELLDLLREPNLDQALARMGGLGLDRALHSHLSAGRDARAAIARARDVMKDEPFAHAVRPELALLACMCAEMAAHEAYEWLDRIRMSRRDQDVVAECISLAPRLIDRLEAEPPPAPSELYELLSGRAAEVPVVTIARSRDPARTKAQLVAYAERVEAVGLDITGDDLRGAGVPESPALGRALRQTLALKLDGFVSGREEELDTALRLASRES
jgi:tRNA nucleotidyltransferase (CCA-adding enzyme)